MRETNKNSDDQIILLALGKVKGILKAFGFIDSDREIILEIEQRAEEKGFMGLGKVVNTGLREVLDCDLIYVALTSMEFDWGCQSSLILKKGEEIVGEEVREEEVIERLSKQKNVWFLHDNFVIYKDKLDFPKDVINKICQFEIPSIPSHWCILEASRFEHSDIFHSYPSTPTDVYLKEHYFENLDQKGLGTILVGVKL